MQKLSQNKGMVPREGNFKQCACFEDPLFKFLVNILQNVCFIFFPSLKDIFFDGFYVLALFHFFFYFVF